MTLSTLPFLLYFLPVSLAVSFLLPDRLKNGALLFLSLVFYAWGNPKDLLLLLAAFLFDYGCGLMMGRLRGQRGKARAVLVCNVVFSLVLLGVFKYAGMAADTVNALTGASLFLPDLLLPLGISFFTFRSISYCVDVARGEAPALKNPIDFGLYLAFFPQMTAGPIVRYAEFFPQLKARRQSLDLAVRGLTRFCTGLFKKLLLADTLSQAAARVQYYDEPSALAAWIGALAFTFQIYFDFSGYSDMAIGLTNVFGFTAPENFLHPYESRSVSEFWRRWHVTLGRWFREYVYIPLGGNRRGLFRLVLNLAAVWLLTGLWHGASWNFVLWGAYYGALIILEKCVFGKLLSKAPKAVGWAYTFLATVVGWVLFSHTELSAAVGALAAMFGGAPGTDPLGLYLLSGYWPLFLLGAVFCTSLPGRLFDRLRQSVPGRIVWCFGFAALLLLSFAAMTGSGFVPFLYAKF